MRDPERAAAAHGQCPCESRVRCAFYWLVIIDPVNWAKVEAGPVGQYMRAHWEELEASYRLGGLPALVPYAAALERGEP